VTQFLNKSFSVALGSDDYRKNYEAAFGKKKIARKPKKKKQIATSP